jgi:hypothetical protein
VMQAEIGAVRGSALESRHDQPWTAERVSLVC